MGETVIVAKRRGRPRKHTQASDRVNDYRNRKQSDGRRLDIFVNAQASWRIAALAKVWGVSRGAAIERLVLEADRIYGDILFPEIKLGG